MKEKQKKQKKEFWIKFWRVAPIPLHIINIVWNFYRAITEPELFSTAFSAGMAWTLSLMMYLLANIQTDEILYLREMLDSVFEIAFSFQETIKKLKKELENQNE